MGGIYSDMFETVARKVLRTEAREKGRKISLAWLDEEATSLAYDLAKVARNRAEEVVSELPR